MTNREILKKAVDRAIKNDIHFEQCLDYLPYYNLLAKEHFKIIFDRRFAKAFWGDEELEIKKGRTFEQYWKEEKEYLKPYGLTKEDVENDWITDIPVLTAWAYHLQQMILEPEPLKYLEKFL